jgi:hypothetical protein
MSPSSRMIYKVFNGQKRAKRFACSTISGLVGTGGFDGKRLVPSAVTGIPVREAIVTV